MAIMKKQTAVLYLLVILAGLIGGALVPSSFYQGRAPMPRAHANAQGTPALLADRQ